MKKEELQEKSILKYLIKKSPTTVRKIAEITELSEKTVRGRLDKIDTFLKQNKIGEIRKEPGKGISIIVFEDSKNELDNFLYTNETLITENERVTEKILIYLLTLPKDSFVTQGWLSKKLFLSIPTLRNELSEVKRWCVSHNIELEIVQRKGMRMNGSEYAKRIGIIDLVLANNKNVGKSLLVLCPGLDVEKVKKIIKQVEKNWKIQFSRSSFNKIWIMICLSIYRGRNGKSDEGVPDDYKGIESYNEYNFSESIYQLLSENGYRGFQERDTRLLAMLIIGASKLTWDFELDSNVGAENNKLTDFINHLIISISDVLGVDLRDDQILANDLKEHLKSAIFRMRFGQKNANTMSKQLKSEYSDAFLSVWSTSQLFEQYFDIQITEDEISFIVLYVEAALMRRKKTVKAILCSNLGRSQSFFVAELIKKNIPAISEIEIIRENNFNRPVPDDVKVVLSNTGVPSSNVIPISPIPTRADFNLISQSIDDEAQQTTTEFYFTKTIQPLFDPKFFFIDLDLKNKEMIVKYMVTKLEENGIVTPYFFDTLWEREEKTSTCIGDGIAIPHGSMDEVNEARICVATLKRPIEWTPGENVRIIFLLAVKMNSQANIKRLKDFYIDLIRFTESEELLKEFSNQKSAIDSFQFLFK